MAWILCAVLRIESRMAAGPVPAGCVLHVGFSSTTRRCAVDLGIRIESSLFCDALPTVGLHRNGLPRGHVCHEDGLSVAAVHAFPAWDQALCVKVWTFCADAWLDQHPDICCLRGRHSSWSLHPGLLWHRLQRW